MNWTIDHWYRIILVTGLIIFNSGLILKIVTILKKKKKKRKKQGYNYSRNVRLAGFTILGQTLNRPNLKRTLTALARLWDRWGIFNFSSVWSQAGPKSAVLSAASAAIPHTTPHLVNLIPPGPAEQHIFVYNIPRSLQEDILLSPRNHLADFNDPLLSFRLQTSPELRHILVRFVHESIDTRLSYFSPKVSHIHHRVSLDEEIPLSKHSIVGISSILEKYNENLIVIIYKPYTVITCIKVFHIIFDIIIFWQRYSNRIENLSKKIG